MMRGLLSKIASVVACVLLAAGCSHQDIWPNGPSNHSIGRKLSHPGDSGSTAPIRLVSVALNGTAANHGSYGASVAGDGSSVAFESSATNLVADDTNGYKDVFIRDMSAQRTALLSHAVGGGPANGPSEDPVMSADGRSVAFVSSASNLVAGDRNHRSDVFLADIATGSVSCASCRLPANLPPEDFWNPILTDVAIDGTGSVVAFELFPQTKPGQDMSSEPRLLSDVLVWSRATGRLTVESLSPQGELGNGYSDGPSLTIDGKSLAFSTGASNIVAGASFGGQERPVLRNLTTGVVTALGPLGSCPVALSGDGNVIAIVRSNRGAGSYYQVVVADRANGRSAIVGGAEDHSYTDHATLSADGSRVAVLSDSPSLVKDPPIGAYQVYLATPWGGTTVLASASVSGVPGNDNSTAPRISGDGRYVVFASQASNLVAGDTNNAPDIFLKGPMSP